MDSDAWLKAAGDESALMTDAIYPALFQIAAGMGIMAWAWCRSLGTRLTTIQEAYFTGFEILPFDWNISLNYLFSLALRGLLFLQVISMVELFGTSIAVQLVQLPLSFIHHHQLHCCCKVPMYTAA
jgi:hypothetical protein